MTLASILLELQVSIRPYSRQHQAVAFDWLK
jgi:hypothetical protein